MDVGGGRVALHDDGLVHDERPPALVISPDARGLGVGGRAAEHAPEHLERRVDPALLIDGRRAIALDARDEEDHEDALAAAAQDLLPAAGLLSARLCHAAINIDRSPRLGNSADSNALVRNPLPKGCPIQFDSCRLTSTREDIDSVAFPSSFHGVGVQGRVPLEGFANAVRRVQVPPRARRRRRRGFDDGRSVGGIGDERVDASTRGRFVEALTEAVCEALAEGDGETAQVAIRALEELARRVEAPREPERVEGDRSAGGGGADRSKDVERNDGQPACTGIELAKVDLFREGLAWEGLGDLAQMLPWLKDFTSFAASGTPRFFAALR